jgi:FkbM family methyltransferase
VKSAVRELVRRAGFDIIRYHRGSSSVDGRRSILMRRRRIELVIDVGANVGPYARQLRSLGYKGRIVSFEPLPGAFATLARAAARDAAWECFPIALGPIESRAALNVAGNSVSSSILPMLERHVRAAPASACRGTVDVEVRPLDSFLENFGIPGSRTHLKLDVQGYEMSVLKGAQRTLSAIDLLELEVSLVPLYEGQPLFREVIEPLEQQGFQLVSLDPGFADPSTGHLLQLDAILERSTTDESLTSHTSGR